MKLNVIQRKLQLSKNTSSLEAALEYKGVSLWVWWYWDDGELCFLRISILLLQEIVKLGLLFFML